MRQEILGTILLFLVAAPVGAAAPWIEGQHYFRIEPIPPDAAAAGHPVVTEVFSYGCPFCAQFNSTAKQLQANLPAKSQFDYIPAAFLRAEDWPMFQRAYCTAQVLEIADQTHDAIFDAVWKTGELATLDLLSQRLKRPLPSLEDAARVYNRLTGVSVEKFLVTAQSAAVDAKVRAADEFVRAYRVDSTPSIIVDRRYRVNMPSVSSASELIDLVKWLIANDAK
ncbi:MAG TPA: thiol:disulfide interchange protein DsbA/DsbL [Steroidobacteraceae bacterium]|jgi:thiol:disulfide interchange protein DsbA|nr:thiol:disulfide interchange protein DsbA/DsbL [Steroidobacteraceae bacterium]